METVLGLWNTELASPPTTGILTFSLKGHQSFHVFTSAFNVSRKVSKRMKRRDASERKRERQDLDMDRGEAGLWKIQDQKEKKTKAISSQTKVRAMRYISTALISYRYRALNGYIKNDMVLLPALIACLVLCTIYKVLVSLQNVSVHAELC